MKHLSFTLPERISNYCFEWSYSCDGTTREEYARRNPGAPVSKFADDHAISKMAEVAHWMLFKNYCAHQPDFAIYSAGEKSWSSDLHLLNDMPVTIKGQRHAMAEKVGLSWVFENGKDRILDKPAGIFAGYEIVQVDNTYTAFLRIHWYAEDLFKTEYLEPLKRYPGQHNKKAIYCDRVQHHGYLVNYELLR